MRYFSNINEAYSFHARQQMKKKHNTATTNISVLLSSIQTNLICHEFFGGFQSLIWLLMMPCRSECTGHCIVQHIFSSHVKRITQFILLLLVIKKQGKKLNEYGQQQQTLVIISQKILWNPSAHELFAQTVNINTTQNIYKVLNLLLPDTSFSVQVVVNRIEFKCMF